MKEYVWYQNMTYKDNIKSIWETGDKYYSQSLSFVSQSSDAFSQWVTRLFNAIGITIEYDGMQSNNIVVGNLNDHCLSFLNTGLFKLWTTNQNYCLALKFKNASGSTVTTLEKKDLDYLIISSGEQWKSVTLYFDDIGFGMDGSKLYLWENKSLDTIISETPHLNNTIESVPSTSTTYQNVSKDYIINDSGTKIPKNILNHIGVKTITIPDYHIDNGLQISGLSFPWNRVDMDSSTLNGSFSHAKGFKTQANQTVNGRYWTLNPHIYPDVVFTNMDSNDLVPIRDGNVVLGYKLKDHEFSYKNNILTIDNKAIEIYDNDEIVFYIRDVGDWKPKTITDWEDCFIFITDSANSITTYKNTGELVCKPITSFVWTPTETNYTFNASVANKHRFITSNNSKAYAKTIIQKCQTTTIDMPVLSDATYDVKRNSRYEYWFISIGDYLYDSKNQTVEYKSDSMLELSATVSNYEWVSYNSNVNIDLNPTHISSQIQLTEVTSNNYEGYGELVSFIRPTVGLWSGFINYFGSATLEDPENQDISTPTGYNQRLKYVYIDDLKEDQLYPYNYHYSYQYVLSGSDFWPTTTYANFYLQLGYSQYIDEQTFALAVVVWRNGKLAQTPKYDSTTPSKPPIPIPDPDAPVIVPGVQ